MEDNKNKRIEEYFANFKDLDLISEGPKKKESVFTNVNLISENSRKEYNPPRYNPINYNNNTISRGTSIKTTNNINININQTSKKTNNNQNSINKAIQKSKSKTNINNKNKKGRKLSTKLIKGILIGSIVVLISIPIGEKIYTHYQTEQVKKECIVQTYEELKDYGFNIENINLEEILNNSDPEYLKENIFELYLIIKENTNLKEENKYLDILVQKAGLDNSFDKYLINEGYHDRQYYSSNGEDYYLSANKAKWENEMESIKLAEKTLQEAKNKGAK